MLVTIMPVYVACNCLVTSVGVVSLVQLGVFLFECVKRARWGRCMEDETGVSRMRASSTMNMTLWYRVKEFDMY